MPSLTVVSPSRATPEALSALMRAAQKGDQAAYTQLLEQVAKRMRGLVRARAPWMNESDIEDMVQDILLALHVARATWDPARPFLPWMVTIARNRLADHARKYVRRAALHLGDQDIADAFVDKPVSGHSDSVVNFMSVRAAMEELSPSERRAMELVRLREMSLAEAALACNSTVAAMKVAVHRATKKLRARLRQGE